MEKSKFYEEKSVEFWKLKDYGNYIYASSLMCWYRAITYSMTNNKIKPKEFVPRHMIVNPRMGKSFQKLNKEEAQEIINEFILNIFLKYEQVFNYIFEVSNYYQNPSKWSKEESDRVDPQNFISGECTYDRVIRLISYDEKCIRAIHTVLSYDFKKEIKNKLLEVFS